VTRDYTFQWSSGDPNEIYVTLNGVLLVEGVLYELEEYTAAYGGVIRFNVAPLTGSVIVIYRQTPITQQVDYVEHQPFPADTHEFQCDKDTRILQEMIFGGRAIGGPVDLGAIQHPENVEVTNTGGTHAILLPWTIDGLNAGVFYGEVIPYGEAGPVDGEPTTKGDGYIWWFEGPAPNVGGDDNIVLSTVPLTISIQQAAPLPAIARFRYNAATGDIEYGADPLGAPWTVEGGITTPPTGLTQYWIKMQLMDGSIHEEANSMINTWLDAYSTIGESNEWMGWYAHAEAIPASGSCVFSIAPDDGLGAPDLGMVISRHITFNAEQI
jgi:hypothetical protein